MSAATSSFHFICDALSRSPPNPFPQRRTGKEKREWKAWKNLLGLRLKKDLYFQSEENFSSRIAPHGPLFHLTLSASNLVFALRLSFIEDPFAGDWDL